MSEPTHEPTQQDDQASLPDLTWEQTKALLDRHLRETPEARDELRRHDVVAGIAGEIGDRIAQAKLAQTQREAAEAAAREREEELLKLSEEDPESFAERFRSEKLAERTSKELATLRYDERKAVANQLGRAVHDLPELKDATQDELAKVAQAIAGVPEDQVIAAWNAAIVDLVSEKRARRLTQGELDERVKAERAAWEAEHAGQAVKNGAAPSLRRGGGIASAEAPDFRTDPKGFDAWYEQNVLNRRRALA